MFVKRTSFLVLLIVVFGWAGALTASSLTVSHHTPAPTPIILQPQLRTRPAAIPVVAVSDVTSFTVRHPIPRWHAFLWALEHKGQPYVWGACGPFGCNGLWYGFDCSGLIYASYKAIGWQYFGRDTYDMLGYGLASGRLQIIPLRDEKAGDLLFYGSGHVGMATGHWGWTYEALNQSLPVGFYSWSWYGYPTMAVHVTGSG